MIVQYYKPNSKNTGCAFSFDIGANNKNQEPCVYVRAVKQYSWDASKRSGFFSGNAKDPEKSISIKNKNYISLTSSKTIFKRSQELSEKYHDAGQFYWGKKNEFLEYARVFNNFYGTSKKSVFENLSSINLSV